MSIVADRTEVRKSLTPDEHAAQQRKRWLKAVAEGATYEFFRADATHIYVRNPHTYAVWTLTKQADGTITCDCPDHANHPELICKHALAASYYRKAIKPLPPLPGSQPLPEVPETHGDQLAAAKAERARRAKEFDRIFG